MRKYILLALIYCLPVLLFAETQPDWQIPVELSTKNTKVRFEVDTTWHMVHGKVKKLSGDIALLDPNNPLSLTAEIHIPVSEITTGWGMRDSSFQDSMGAEDFPEIVYKANSFISKESCTVESLNKSSCRGTLNGTLKIKDVERSIALGVTIKKQKQSYQVSGAITFPWGKFNVEDPSIVMAKVQPDVTVFYEVNLAIKK